jgi:hypothetical protein
MRGECHWATIAVSVCTALMVPCAANSTRMLRVMDRNAVSEAEQVLVVGRLTSAASDSMFTTAPPPEAERVGLNARVSARGQNN